MKPSVLFGNIAGLWVLTTATTAPAQTPGVARAQLYDLTTEIGMPHLEENLRYTLQHAKACLTDQALASAFPILGHPALHGCSLRDETRAGTTVSYTLVCEGGHGTRGDAIWRFEKPAVRGMLRVTLGGKNMTFYQRITAISLGACTPEPR